MSLSYPSVEGEFLEIQDPWDWSVDEVVFAVTHSSSQLLKSNKSLSLPKPDTLSDILRENDVNGLALLTEVNGASLRNELGIRSMSHRASINYLIRQLQDQSTKYKKHFSGRISSLGANSRLATPYAEFSLNNDYRDNAGFPGHWPSPLGSTVAIPNSSWNTNILVRENTVQKDCNFLAQSIEPPTPNHQAAEKTVNIEETDDSSYDHSKAYLTDSTVGYADQNNGATKLGVDHNIVETSPRINQININPRQCETVITDENGKKRRRLMLIPSDTSRPEGLNPEKQTLPLDQSPPLTVPTSNQDAPFSVDSISPNHIEPPYSQDSHGLAEAHESRLPAQIETPPLCSSDDDVEPGILLRDREGRKRMRPILISQPEPDPEETRCTITALPKPKCITPTSDTPQSLHVDHERVKGLQQRSYGRTASRSPNQIYLGLDSLAVDTIFYGDTALGTCLDDTQMQDTDTPNSFSIVPAANIGNGRRLYVNSRMRFLLQSKIITVRRNGQEHVGIIPYPDRLGRKHHPLSMTVFSKTSTGDVLARRANRVKWIEQNLDFAHTTNGNFSQNVFNVIDPSLIQRESEDPEWNNLEKWKYMNGKDEVLPVYGDSGSEGEYELDIWREIEKEGGKITRPAAKFRSRLLTNEEVEETVKTTMEELLVDWRLKQRPKLEAKSWRRWVRSRKDGTKKVQIADFVEAIQKLDARITALRKEIMGEEWSTRESLAKQCKILQPSLFDLEDYKWNIVNLQSRNPPNKPRPVTKKAKSSRVRAPRASLEHEEIPTSSTESSQISDDSLDDFIVEDRTEVDQGQPHPTNDDLTLADVEDVEDSDTLLAEADGIAARTLDKDSQTPVPQSGLLPKDTQAADQRCTDFIDLTQQSDPKEPKTPPAKIERTFEIKTPPLYNTEDDSDLFERSRGKKPVFKTPLTQASRNATIIDLDMDMESESAESTTKEEPPFQNPMPAFTEVEKIRQMDPCELVERQDRKRLLIWLVAHSPSLERSGASKYLNGLSLEKSFINIKKALKDLKSYRQRILGLDKETSDVVMRLATWYVCWTIPVKVDQSRGLNHEYIDISLADEDGYEPFYDFLLDCLDRYQTVPVPGPQGSTPKKKRQRILLEDSDGQDNSPFRKRKYFVPESQGTLDKRQAAQDRMRANEERRRREELKSRFNGMGSLDTEVVVNPGKHEDEEFIYLNRRFGNGLPIRPHQKEGLQFMWREITSDHENLQGCLLAHSQGLGKTMQVIALLVTVAEAAKSTSKNIRQQVPFQLRESQTQTLILCPPSLIENWWDELLMWPPAPLSDHVGEVRKVSSAMKPHLRLGEIQTWSEDGGILIIGYDTFRDLILNKARGGKKSLSPLSEDQHHLVKEALLDRTKTVIADEAQNIKNQASGISKAINQIKSTSRIALTGTPLSNDLGEYYSVIDWIAPNYLGTSIEFRATYEEPIYEGLYAESTELEYRRSRKKLRALELELEPKIHRAGNDILHAELKGKSEFVIKVPLTKLQEELYTKYVGSILLASQGNEPGSATLWSWLSILQLLCNHPQSYRERLLQVEDEAKTLSERHASGQSLGRNKTKVQFTPEEALIASDEDSTLLDEPVSRMAISQAIVESQKVFDELRQPLGAPSLSHKMQVLMSIVQLSESAGDKMLIFSHRIPTLNYIGEQLEKERKVYVRIDGKLPPQKRQSVTKSFNERDANICLVSTRAGGTGLNLWGANRVVILDEMFNPTWEQQAIGRAYRIGQQKHVYVYRITVAGTFEQAMSNQALFKQQLATRVVDKKNPNRSARKGARQYLFLPKAVEQEDLSGFFGKDAHILDHLLNDRVK